MAGAKETPRQKLISLMYLVFITMLALNVSKEVLDGFGQMFKKLKQANERVVGANQVFYDLVKTNAEQQQGIWIDHLRTTNEIKKASDTFYNKIQEVKDKITEIQRVEDPELNEYRKMDKGDLLNQEFFGPEGVSEGGQAFVDMINQYKGEVIKVFGSRNPEYIQIIEDRFFTGDQNYNIKNKDGQDQSWLSANYEGFPLISSLAKLTMMQNDIRATETMVLNKIILGGLIDISTVDDKNYFSILTASKGAYYQGEKFDGQIILGRKGGAQEPNDVDLSVDGIKLKKSDYDLISGGVKLKINAGRPGDHTIKGNLIFLDGDKTNKIPVDQSFAVIAKPNAAIISADKMNVVYRGVENPMTVSIPGISSDKIRASAPGLKKAKGSSYIMIPGKGNEVTINASGKLPDGGTVSTKTKFRIKDVPAPSGTVRGQTGNISISKSNLGRTKIGAKMVDFDFDITLETVSFKFKVSGKPTITVKGNRLNSQAKQLLEKVRSGATVTVFDIKVRNPKNPGYKFRKISPVIIEIL